MTISVYEMASQHYDLSSYVFFAARTDFISANREGIVSLLGYFSLQMIGVGLGRMLLSDMMSPEELEALKSGKPVPKQQKSTESLIAFDKLLLLKVLLLECLLLFTYATSVAVFGEPSRRLCNLPYVLYQTSLVWSFVFHLIVIDRLLVAVEQNMVDDAINWN